MPQDEAEALALRALAWALGDEARARRLLDITGLTPEVLREGLDQPQVLAATLEFLANHEPDLVAAAAALDVQPPTLIAAQHALSQGHSLS